MSYDKEIKTIQNSIKENTGASIGEILASHLWHEYSELERAMCWAEVPEDPWPDLEIHWEKFIQLADDIHSRI